MTDTITAPWTPDQVDRLNRFQHTGYVHPFTCPDAHDGADRTLVATKAGWVCPHCDYRQNWAHAVMLEVVDPAGLFPPILSELQTALKELVKLQSHYAGLLNQHDGGLRLRFASAAEWIDRLRVTGTLK